MPEGISKQHIADQLGNDSGGEKYHPGLFGIAG